ncbi:hypothetical protein BDV06DRAFT_230814 [Aspergillus oleicola]
MGLDEISWLPQHLSLRTPKTILSSYYRPEIPFQNITPPPGPGYCRRNPNGVSLYFKAAGLEESPKAVLVEFLDAEHNGRSLPLIPRQISLIWYIEYTPRLFKASDSHGPVDRTEISEAAQVVVKDPRVQTEIKRLQIDTTVLDPWGYGVDGHPDSCHYSFPLDFMVIVDLCKMEVKKIIGLPLGADQKATKVETDVPHRRTNPVEPEYTYYLHKNPPPTTMKPYQVFKSEGASFTVKGYLFKWEKWRFLVGFNWHEEITLRDVSFDDRSVFYRLSLSEMFVPYGDPRNPIYCKGAFDLGNVGEGVNGNNFQLGCDCLGLIKDLGGCAVLKDGTPAPRPNAIYIHEIDDELALETRATGILFMQPINENAKVQWGTRVADGVMAPYHQHLFNLRIDPAIGGYQNSFVATDTVPISWDDDLNPLGTGFITGQQIIDRAGTIDDDISNSRVFKILNENVENPVSLIPIGCKLMLLARPGSWHWRRSEFCESPIWVNKYKDRQIFPAGDYTNREFGGTGIKSSLNGCRDSVRNEDIVIWHTCGFTHNPRTKDFPIMQAEIGQVRLVLYNFATHNRTIDVTPSTQAFSKNVERSGNEELPAKCSGGRGCR